MTAPTALRNVGAPYGRVPLDRICIVMMSAVGDVVHVMPLVTAIKRVHPSAHITWVLQPGPATLVRDHPDVDEIILFDRSAGMRGFTEVRRALHAAGPFDLCINLQVYFKAGLITSFVPARVKLGFDRARARDGNWLFTNAKIPPHAMQHVQDQYFEFLDALGIPYEPVRWDIGPREDERAWQRAFFAPIDRPVASIVVATSKAQKDWMPERWAVVCDALFHDHGLQPVLVGGRSDRELAAEAIIMRETRVAPISALGSGLRKLAAIIDGSALVLSPDTGPLHLSVALDRPVVSLIGYSNPKRVGPYRKFADLMIDAYGDPGEDYPISMANRLDRMPRISVADVLARVAVWESAYRES